MVFAARDYFEAGISIPPDTTNPSSGPLFDYIVKRLFDSFNLLLPPPPPLPFITPIPPFGPGPLTYMHLMNPALPDHETTASNVGSAPRGRAWIMVNDEWPKIKADIENGSLSPIALVEIKSLDPFEMGNNHQVLAYGYDLDGTDLAILVYDPNYPNDDTVTMSLSIADPQHTTPVTYSKGETVWCFFRPVYSFSHPPFDEGRRGSSEFDVKFYLAAYPDLQAAFGTNYGAAFDHWVNQGLPNEGRRGSREFDVKYYLSTYPDLQAAFGTNFRAALDHWVIHGIAEGRKGTA
jgi:hypothetical protein